MSETNELLVGRDDELERLRRRVALAAASQGQVLLLDGPVGSGRSAMASHAAAAASAAGLPAVIARCGWRESGVAWTCVRQLGATAPTAEPTPAATVAVAGQLLAAVREPGACLVVDDAHWADRPSLEALLQVARHADDRPLLLVFTATREAATPGALGVLDELRALPGTTLMTLAPLDAQDARALVGRRSGPDTPATAGACERWVALTGGNALLLTEVIDAAVAADGAVVDGATPGDRVPERVRAAVATRLARLGDDVTAFARALHVLGAQASLPRVIALAGLDQARGEAAAGTLVEVGICRHDQTVAFTVPLIDNAVGAGIDSFASSLWHRRAAALLLANESPAEQVARHLMQTHPAGEDWVVEPLRAAADIASTAGNVHESARLLARALDEPPVTEVVPALLSDLAFAESRAGAREAFVRIEAALAVAPSREARLRLRREQTRLMWLAGRLPEAVRCSELAVSEADPGSEIHGQMLAELLAVASMDDMATIYERPALVKLLDRARSGWVPASPALAATLAAVLPFVVADHRLVPPLTEQALTEDLWRLDAPPFGMRPDFVIGSLWVTDGLATAARIVEEGKVLATSGGDVVRLAILHYWLGVIRYDEGDLDAAVAQATVATAPREGNWFGHSAATLANAHLDRGELARARAAVLMTEGRVDPGQLPGIEADLAHVRLQLHEARAAEALVLAGDIGARLASLGHGDGPTIVWRLLAAKAARVSGDDALARRLVEEEVAIARATHATGRLGRALRAAAHCDPSTRLETLSEACAVLARTPRRLERAKALLALGRELHAREDVAGARTALAEARELAEACGATPLAREALISLNATGARPRRSARSGPEALTGAERRIVDLAAAGLTNRKIGEHLTLGARTVEWHLGNAFAKLGVSSRRDLRQVLDLPPGT